MKLIARYKEDQNQAAIDPWTAVHLTSGMVAGLTNMPFKASLVASTVYELSEQVFERQEWGQRLFAANGPEALPNAIADTVFFALGYGIGKWWNRNTRPVPSKLSRLLGALKAL